eukprot:5095180-Heterocapsa_arctica.AAC.1
MALGDRRGQHLAGVFVEAADHDDAGGTERSVVEVLLVLAEDEALARRPQPVGVPPFEPQLFTLFSDPFEPFSVHS